MEFTGSIGNDRAFCRGSKLDLMTTQFEVKPVLEEAIQFTADSYRLYGIVHAPENPIVGLPIVLMMVGGPQTRVGSHRGYVQIARSLCRGGATVVRFDYRGVGDGDGDYVTYTYSETSLIAALDWIGKNLGQKPVVLWSLCDGAAACMVFGPRLGPSIVGMILCNPYVHSQQNRAETLIKYYYLRRILEKSFWIKLFSFNFNPLTFGVSFLSLVKSAVSSRAAERASAKQAKSSDNGSEVGNTQTGPEEDPTGFAEDTLQVRMIDGIKKFRKPILFLLSSADLTADQFRTLLEKHNELIPLFKRKLLSIRSISGGDHTFSNLNHKRQVAAESLVALKSYL